MENQYGIVVANKFDLFANEDDPLDILQEIEKSKKKDDKPAKKDAKNDKSNKSAKLKPVKKVLAPVQDQKAADDEQNFPKKDGELLSWRTQCNGCKSMCRSIAFSNVRGTHVFHPFSGMPYLALANPGCVSTKLMLILTPSIYAFVL